MGLYEDVTGKPVRRWTRNLVDELLGEDEAAELVALLTDTTVSPFAIWRALRDRHIGVSKATVYDWAGEARRGPR